MTQVQHDLFDCAQLSPGTGLEAFRHISETLFECWPLGDYDAFHVRAEGHSLGSLVFNQVEFSPIRVRRDQRHLSRPGSDYLVLEQFIEGTEDLYLPMQQIKLTPGHINLRDWSVGFDGYSPCNRRLRSIVIPRHMLPSSDYMGLTKPILSWDIQSHAGRMLQSLWNEVLAALNSERSGDVPNLCRGFLGFIEAMIPGSDEICIESKTAQMQRYLKDKLNPAISVHDLCDAFGVSRTTVYERFTQFGGVDKYVLRLRLDSCYTELRYSDPSTLRVSDIALEHGFDDSAVFSRQFKRHFGVTPTQVLGSALRPFAPLGEADGQQSSAYRNWFETNQ